MSTCVEIPNISDYFYIYVIILLYLDQSFVQSLYIPYRAFFLYIHF